MPSGSGGASHLLWISAGALLLAVTVLVFLRVFSAEFVRWDDQYYVEDNRLLQNTGGLEKIWNPGSHGTEQYYPLTFTSYWLEYRLWGLDARGYHATNVVLHLINVLLVLALLRQFGVSLWVTVAVATVFAIHPTQVASVAWISERKNTLSGVFYLTAFLLYLRHRRTGGWGSYGASLLSFAAALLSKTQTLTLPASLLLAEWCLQRSGRLRRTRLAAVGARTAPMLALCVAATVITITFEERPWTPTFTVSERLFVVANTAWFYARTFIAPISLSPIYTAWHVSVADPWSWAAVVAWPLLLALFAYGRRRIPALALWGMGHFFLVLMPVLGFVPFNFQTYALVADHFLYLAGIGGGLTLALCAERLAGSQPAWLPRRVLVTGVAALLLAGCAAQTFRETSHWRDNEAFWTRVRARDPDGFLGNYNLGQHYRRQGRWPEAVPFYRKASEIWQNAGYAFRRYTEALRHTQGPQAVIEACNARLMKNARSYSAYLERATSYESLGQLSRAIDDYAQVMHLARRGSTPWQHARRRYDVLRQHRHPGG